jgi:hypothetical protein
MNESMELSLEKQFSLREFEVKVQNITHIEAQELLVTLYRHMLAKDSIYQKMLKQQWGMEAS